MRMRHAPIWVRWTPAIVLAPGLMLLLISLKWKLTYYDYTSILELESGNLSVEYDIDNFFIFSHGWEVGPAGSRFQWKWPAIDRSVWEHDYGPNVRAGDNRKRLTLPLWLVLVLSGAAAYPLRFAVFRCVMRYRRSRGACPSCAYDLTGNVSSICPECGQKV